MQSPDGNQLWCPGQSLWSLIGEHVPESGLPKIHTALGHSLVDMYTEVHTEAERWHKLWQQSQQGNSLSRAGTPLPRQQAPLADPPVVKELLRAEVKMLLQTLRERASMEGRDGEELLFRYKPESVHYALSHLDSCYRNCSSPGDTDNESRPSSHCSVQSDAEDQIEAMRDKLNVIDIDQVVDRLRSLLMDESEALKRLVKHFKGGIIQKCGSQCEFDKSEPTLADLKDLRGALQTDLKLRPSSLADSPSAASPLRSKELKNRLRLSAGKRVPVSDETLRTLSTTSALRPHPPPPPLSHAKPRPPLRTPPNKTSAPAKLINSSSVSHGQQRSTSASTEAQKTQTPICNRIITPGHVSSHSLTTSPSFHMTSPRNSPIHKTHMSPERSIHSLSRKCDLLPHRERRSSPAWRSRNISTVSSSPRCDADSTGKSKTQNGQQSRICRGSLVSATVQTDNERRKNTSERLQSATPAQTVGGKSNNRTDQKSKITKQQSLVATCTHPASTQTSGQLFTYPQRPLEGATSQTQSVQEEQTQLEFISKFYQPVPPARVST
ncbi:coiled-coil domain-containing protein 24 [Centropristis striata]|uniref:coiled-coil domain-containing protein 24 n=1 Tax=Centropristis striata TaxID=184440 RepID=UPI0027DF6EFF|nr:coiled-coil domain-containing protein 24 [Centropristis striata]